MQKRKENEISGSESNVRVEDKRDLFILQLEQNVAYLEETHVKWSEGQTRNHTNMEILKLGHNLACTTAKETSLIDKRQYGTQKPSSRQ